MDLRNQRRFTCRDSKMRTQAPRTESFLQRLNQLGHAFASAGRNRHTSGKTVQIAFHELTVLQSVDLVKHNQRLLSKRIELFGHALDRLDLLVHSRMAQVDDVDQEI